MRNHIFLFGALCYLIGCQNSMPPNNFPRQTDSEREEIIEAFATNPNVATEKYEKRWHQAIGSEELDEPIKVTIAGELMAHGDSANYSTYYNYVVAHARSKEGAVAALAMSALSRARGRDSAELLLHFTDDSRDEVALEAMTAINYRLATAFYDSALNEEKDFFMSKLPELCKKKYSSELEQFCVKHH